MSFWGLFRSPNIESLKAERDIPGLIKALSFPKNALIRQQAAKALGEFKDQRSIEPLAAALKDNDPSTRCAAARALETFNLPHVVEALMAALQDENQQVRTVALDVLERMQIIDARLVNSLINSLEQKSFSIIAIREIRLLKQIGDSRAVDILTQLLTDSNMDIRKAAAEALETLKPDSTDARRLEIAVATRNPQAILELGTAAVQPLIKLLKDKNTESRDFIVAALGQLGDPRAVKPLMTALRDKDMGVRETAAKALEKLGDARAVEPLIKALEDKFIGVRGASAEALERLRDPKAASALLKAYKARQNSTIAFKLRDALSVLEPDLDVHMRAEIYVETGRFDQAIGLGEAALDPLLRVFADVTKVNQVEDIAAALGKLGDTRVVEPLMAQFQEASPRKKAALVEVLGQLKDARAITTLIIALKEGQVIGCETAFRQILAHSAAQIPVDDLQVLAQLENLETTIAVWDGDWDAPHMTPEQHTVDFSEVRRLAHRELTRRGMAA